MSAAAAAPLPRLMDRKQIALELGVTLHTAERIMRHVPKIPVGRRIYVTDVSVRDYLRSVESK